jgi:hypothetical protein
MFAMKIHQKYIFHLREAHILAQLDITAGYTQFYEVLKNIEFRLKTQRQLASVLQKMSVRVQYWLKSVFPPSEAHILARLNTTMLYKLFL